MCEYIGAIEIETQKFFLPQHLNKDDKTRNFSCIACDEPLILKVGKIKRNHFSHYPKSKCIFSSRNSKGESEKHLNAKFKLAYLLKYKIPIKMLVECPYDHTCYLNEVEIKYEDSDKIEIEYSKNESNGFVADIAVINSMTNSIKYIFEICHTHKTSDITKLLRPEPWFEVKADEILSLNSYSLNDEDKDTKSENIKEIGDGFSETKSQKEDIKLKCIREIEFKEGKDDKVYRFCDICVELNKPWVYKIPKLSRNVGYKEMWKQEHPCLHCDNKTYSPYYNKGYRQVCKICIYSYTNEIKSKFI